MNDENSIPREITDQLEDGERVIQEVPHDCAEALYVSMARSSSRSKLVERHFGFEPQLEGRPDKDEEELIKVFNELFGRQARRRRELAGWKLSRTTAASPFQNKGLPSAEVNTMHKTKANKVQPRDDIRTDGMGPEGDPDWKREAGQEVEADCQPGGRLEGHVTPKFSKIERGSRLTPERLSSLISQASGIMNEEEKERFAEILYNREAALA